MAEDTASPGRPPKVLHVEVTLGPTNAAYNEHCLPIADRGRVAICSFLKAEVVPPEGLPVFDGDGSFPGFYRAVRSALAHDDYDVVHAHTVHVAFMVLLARVLTPLRFPAATVYTFHSSFPNYRLRYQLLLLPVFAAFRRIVACGEASRESLPRLYRRLARRPVVGIPNGVDLERVDRIAKGCPPRASDAPFTVISLGRLIEVKNPFSILEAFRAGAGPDGRLLMLGIGGLRDELQRACRADGIADRVEFFGLLPREDAFEQLNRADLFISTSWHEGVPVAVLEAMASRRPVVLSDIAPHREIVGGSNLVRLVPPDDPAGFAREIARIAAMSTGERNELGERCRALVEERFGLSTMHQRYGEVYRSALEMGGL